MAYHEVILTGTFEGQICLNRWTYRSSGTPAAVSLSFGLASAFGGVFTGATPPVGSIIEQIKTLVSANYTFDSILVQSIYNLTDFFSTPIGTGVVGGDSGVSMSPANAYGARTNRTRRDVRRATKRFVGTTVAGLQPGGIIGTVSLGRLQELCTRMSTNLTYDDSGNTLTYEPVVLGKQSYTTLSGKTAYRYYPTEAEQDNWVMDSIIWEAYTQIRTQRSRQYGVGQ